MKVRSHTGPIHGLAFDPRRDEFCTVSSDATIRVWSAHSLDQLYEFVSPQSEAVTSVAYAPQPALYQLLVGSEHGFVRVIDVASAKMLVEYRVCMYV